MTSFFGGDPGMAHWAVRPETHEHTYRCKMKDERDAARAENKRRRDTVRAAGGKTTYYYQFRVANEAQKASQKVAAEEHAARLAERFGFPFSVNEGCFL